jgi:initiation factor 1A
MVKNQFGGSSHKKFARKNSAPNENRQNVRTAKEEGEIYANVVKIYGGGVCGVKDMDGREYMCIIRGKFRGKDKKNNLVEIGTWVLVGLRDWETTAKDEKAKCDLLEIYTKDEFSRLKKMVRGNWVSDEDGVETTQVSGVNNNSQQIIFQTNEDEFEYNQLMASVNSTALIGENIAEKKEDYKYNTDLFDIDSI